MSFKAYMQNVQAKSGKTAEDFYRIATEKGFIVDGKIVASHKQLLEWLKSDIGLGHIHANFVITYLRLRTHDPKVSEQMKKWANETGYQE
jgi:Domain of unknown function (DUF4287)